MLFLPNHTPKLQEITREKVANLLSFVLQLGAGYHYEIVYVQLQLQLASFIHKQNGIQ